MAGRSCDAVLVLMSGLPGAGKTTLVKHLVASSTTLSRLYERISFDDLYEQMATSTVEFDPDQWKYCQQEMMVQVSRRIKELLKIPVGDTGSASQLVLLVDDNFQYRSQRKRFYQLAVEQTCGFAILFVNTPTEICRERNAGRNKKTRVPDEVFQRTEAAFEPPNGDQNLWEVNTCEFDGMGDISDAKELVNTLIQQAENKFNERRLVHLEKKMEEAQQRIDRLATQHSVLHRVDLKLRQWISAQLQDEKVLSHGTPKAQLASQLNQRRKKFLASMKRSPCEFSDLFPSEDIEQVVVSLVLRFQQQQE
ncbi:ATPase family associated domain-containing protein 33 [Phytophthora infestans]|uniref:AAA domain n=1 Tax=Phytophthora infestans TaxID=4787 RepID=A0A833WY98_PHYIN|nr:ATPase family associated domain-containing protein 33 [Phytophthora infestans]KAF4138008.1 AAA domain [Phytophthora infestans]